MINRITWADLQKEKREKEKERKKFEALAVVGYWFLMVAGAVVVGFIGWAVLVVIV